MKYTLKKLDEHYYLLSDNEIKDGDWCYIKKYNQLYKATQEFKLGGNPKGYKKIEATTDLYFKSLLVNKLRLSQIETLLSNIEVISENKYQYLLNKSLQDPNHPGYGKGLDGTSKERWNTIFKLGYNQALQDNAEKKFTLEDMRKLLGRMWFESRKQDAHLVNAISDVIKFLPQEQTEWECTIEEEIIDKKWNAKYTHFDLLLTKELRPKITNEYIKITKILK